MTLLDRFLRYVAVDTCSDPNSDSYPSTAKQLVLLNMLVEELLAMGLSDVEIDPNGYVTACIPSNTDKKVPTLAFIAHVDTSPEVSGTNVQAQIVDYQGGDLVINQADGLVIPASDLTENIGDRLITSDGTTLLGADDKAGIAEIMTALEYFITHPEEPHGTIKVLFTPDEEIGSGVDHLNVASLGAKYAYTVDGGECGSLEWETFNAAQAEITFSGLNYHPGYAKGVMINSQTLAQRFQSLMPALQTPEHTCEREGFYHLINSEGNVEQTRLTYIIRDHDKQKFEARKEFITNLATQLNLEQSKQVVSVKLTDQYYNMGEVIKNHPEVIEIAERAMIMAGVKPVVEAIRGGTDGSRLSFMGLPCPNIFSGAKNIHSRLEFVSERVMLLSVLTVVNIVKIFYAKSLQN